MSSFPASDFTSIAQLRLLRLTERSRRFHPEERRPVAAAFSAAGRFLDLHHIGTQVAELHCGKRFRGNAAEVKNFHPPSSGDASDHDIRQILHRGRNNVWLVRCLAERPSAPIDERGPHAGRFRADAIERVVCDEQHLVHAKAE
jgi:hypothetical protein